MNTLRVLVPQNACSPQAVKEEMHFPDDATGFGRHNDLYTDLLDLLEAVYEVTRVADDEFLLVKHHGTDAVVHVVITPGQLRVHAADLADFAVDILGIGPPSLAAVGLISVHIDELINSHSGRDYLVFAGTRFEPSTGRIVAHYPDPAMCSFEGNSVIDDITGRRAAGRDDVRSSALTTPVIWGNHSWR